MYKLICSNLTKSHRSLTNFTGYYRRVAEKYQKDSRNSKKYASDSDLQRNNSQTIEENATEPSECAEEVLETEKTPDKVTKSYVSNSNHRISKSPLSTSESNAEQKIVPPTRIPSSFLHTTNSNYKRSDASFKKDFRNKEAEKYYKSALEQCMHIKQKLDKFYQEATMAARPPRLISDLQKECKTQECVEEEKPIAKIPKKSPLKEDPEQTKKPNPKKISEIKPIKQRYQFKPSKMRITYPTHTVRYKLGTYKPQHKVKQQIVSDNELKTVYKDAAPEQMQSSKIKQDVSSGKDKSAMKQKKKMVHQSRVPHIAALLRQKRIEENSEEAKQLQKFEEAVIKHHPTFRMANSAPKTSFNSRFNKLLQKSSLLYKAPKKDKSVKSQGDDVRKGDADEEKVAPKKSAPTTNPPLTTKCNKEIFYNHSKTQDPVLEPRVMEHPIGSAKQDKIDVSRKSCKRILSEKLESFDVEAMCIKNNATSNIDVNYGDFIAESDENVQSFVNACKSEAPKEPTTETANVDRVTKSAVTIGDYLNKLKALRDQTAIDRLNVAKNETAKKLDMTKKTIEERMDKTPPKEETKKVGEHQEQTGGNIIPAIDKKDIKKKQYPILDSFPANDHLKSYDIQNKIDGRVQAKEEKKRSQSVVSLRPSKSPIRRPIAVPKKFKSRPQTPNEKYQDRKDQNARNSQTDLRAGQTKNIKTLSRIMEKYKIPSKLEYKPSMAEVRRAKRRQNREKEKKLREELKLQQQQLDREEKEAILKKRDRKIEQNQILASQSKPSSLMENLQEVQKATELEESAEKDTIKIEEKKALEVYSEIAKETEDSAETLEKIASAAPKEEDESTVINEADIEKEKEPTESVTKLSEIHTTETNLKMLSTALEQQESRDNFDNKTEEADEQKQEATDSMTEKKLQGNETESQNQHEDHKPKRLPGFREESNLERHFKYNLEDQVMKAKLEKTKREPANSKNPLLSKNLLVQEKPTTKDNKIIKYPGFRAREKVDSEKRSVAKESLENVSENVLDQRLTTQDLQIEEKMETRPEGNSEKLLDQNISQAVEEDLSDQKQDLSAQKDDLNHQKKALPDDSLYLEEKHVKKVDKLKKQPGFRAKEKCVLDKKKEGKEQAAKESLEIGSDKPMDSKKSFIAENPHVEKKELHTQNTNEEKPVENTKKLVEQNISLTANNLRENVEKVKAKKVKAMKSRFKGREKSIPRINLKNIASGVPKPKATSANLEKSSEKNTNDTKTTNDNPYLKEKSSDVKSVDCPQIKEQKKMKEKPNFKTKEKSHSGTGARKIIKTNTKQDVVENVGQIYAKIADQTSTQDDTKKKPKLKPNALSTKKNDVLECSLENTCNDTLEAQMMKEMLDRATKERNDQKHTSNKDNAEMQGKEPEQKQGIHEVVLEDLEKDKQVGKSVGKGLGLKEQSNIKGIEADEKPINENLGKTPELHVRHNVALVENKLGLEKLAKEIQSRYTKWEEIPKEKENLKMGGGDLEKRVIKENSAEAGKVPVGNIIKSEQNLSSKRKDIAPSDHLSKQTPKENLKKAVQRVEYLKKALDNIQLESKHHKTEPETTKNDKRQTEDESKTVNEEVKTQNTPNEASEEKRSDKLPNIICQSKKPQGKQFPEMANKLNTIQLENLKKLREAGSRIIELVSKIEDLKPILIAENKDHKSATPENRPTIRKEPPEPADKDKSKKEQPKSKKGMVLPPKRQNDPKIQQTKSQNEEEANKLVKDINREIDQIVSLNMEQNKKSKSLTHLEGGIKSKANNETKPRPKEELEKKLSIRDVNKRKYAKEYGLHIEEAQRKHDMEHKIDMRAIKEGAVEKKERPKIIIKVKIPRTLLNAKPTNNKIKEVKSENLKVLKKISMTSSGTTKPSQIAKDTVKDRPKTTEIELRKDRKTFFIAKTKRGKIEEDITKLDIRLPKERSALKNALLHTQNDLDKYCGTVKKRKIEDDAIPKLELKPRKIDDKVNAKASLNKSIDNVIKWHNQGDTNLYFAKLKRERIEDAVQKPRLTPTELQTQKSDVQDKNKHTSSSARNSISLASVTSGKTRKEIAVRKAEAKPKSVEGDTKSEKQPTASVKQATPKRVKHPVKRKFRSVSKIEVRQNRPKNAVKRPKTTSHLITTRQLKKNDEEHLSSTDKPKILVQEESQTAKKNVKKLIQAMKTADEELEEVLKAYELFKKPQKTNPEKSSTKSTTKQNAGIKNEKTKPVNKLYQNEIDSKTYVVLGNKSKPPKKDDATEINDAKPPTGQPDRRPNGKFKKAKSQQKISLPTTKKDPKGAKNTLKTKRNILPKDCQQQTRKYPKKAVKEIRTDVQRTATKNPEDATVQSKQNDNPIKKEDKTSETSSEVSKQTKADSKQSGDDEKGNQNTSGGNKDGATPKEFSDNKLLLHLLTKDGKEVPGNKIVVTCNKEDGTTDLGKPEETKESAEKKAVEIPGKRNASVIITTDQEKQVSILKDKRNGIALPKIVKKLEAKNYATPKKKRYGKNIKESDTATRTKQERCIGTMTDTSMEEVEHKSTITNKSQSKLKKVAVFAISKSTLIDRFIKANDSVESCDDTSLTTIFVNKSVFKSKNSRSAMKTISKKKSVLITPKASEAKNFDSEDSKMIFDPKGLKVTKYKNSTIRNDTNKRISAKKSSSSLGRKLGIGKKNGTHNHRYQLNASTQKKTNKPEPKPRRTVSVVSTNTRRKFLKRREQRILSVIPEEAADDCVTIMCPTNSPKLSASDFDVYKVAQSTKDNITQTTHMLEKYFDTITSPQLSNSIRTFKEGRKEGESKDNSTDIRYRSTKEPNKDQKTMGLLEKKLTKELGEMIVQEKTKQISKKRDTVEQFKKIPLGENKENTDDKNTSKNNFESELMDEKPNKIDNKEAKERDETCTKQTAKVKHISTIGNGESIQEKISESNRDHKRLMIDENIESNKSAHINMLKNKFHGTAQKKSEEEIRTNGLQNLNTAEKNMDIKEEKLGKKAVAESAKKKQGAELDDKNTVMIWKRFEAARTEIQYKEDKPNKQPLETNEENEKSKNEGDEKLIETKHCIKVESAKGLPLKESKNRTDDEKLNEMQNSAKLESPKDLTLKESKNLLSNENIELNATKVESGKGFTIQAPMNMLSNQLCISDGQSQVQLVSSPSKDIVKELSLTSTTCQLRPKTHNNKIKTEKHNKLSYSCRKTRQLLTTTKAKESRKRILEIIEEDKISKHVHLKKKQKTCLEPESTCSILSSGYTLIEAKKQAIKATNDFFKANIKKTIEVEENPSAVIKKIPATIEVLHVNNNRQKEEVPPVKSGFKHINEDQNLTPPKSCNVMKEHFENSMAQDKLKKVFAYYLSNREYFKKKFAQNKALELPQNNVEEDIFKSSTSLQSKNNEDKDHIEDNFKLTVSKAPIKARIEEIFNKHHIEDDKIHRFNRNLVKHIQNRRGNVPKKFHNKGAATWIKTANQKYLEANYTQKMLYKFLSTELNKPYHERSTGFSLLKKYNRCKTVAPYSKDKGEKLPVEQPKKEQDEELTPKRSETIYIERIPQSRYKEKIEEPPKPVARTCERLCLPFQKISQVALKPSIEEMMTLHKDRVEKIQMVPKTQPQYSEKYKGLNITHLSPRRMRRRSDESFLPTILSSKNKIKPMEGTKNPEMSKREVLEFRYELLRKLHKEFTDLYGKDLNNNAGRFEKVSKYYSSVVENNMKKDEEIVIRPQTKSIDELMGPCPKPSFERVSRYYNSIVQKEKQTDDKIKNQTDNVNMKATSSTEELIQKFSEDTTDIDKNRNEGKGMEQMMVKSRKKDNSEGNDPDNSGKQN